MLVSLNPEHLSGSVNMLYLPNGEFDAKASTTEEPDAGKLHVRVCVGSVRGVSGNGRSYREIRSKETMEISFLSEYPESTAEIAQWYYDEWAGPNPTTTVEQIALNIKKKAESNYQIPLSFVAHNDNALIGVVELKFRENKNHPEYEHWLGGLFVKPECRGSGVCSSLINRVKQHSVLLELEKLYLQCEENLVPMYRKYTFRELHKAKHRDFETTIMCWDVE